MGRLLKRTPVKNGKEPIYVEIKDEENDNPKRARRPVMWGSKDAAGKALPYVVEVSLLEAYADYCKSPGLRQKETLQRFKDQIEGVFHPEVLVGERVNEGPRWRFGTLYEAEEQFATVLPCTSGFTFQGYRDYLHQETEQQRVAQQKRMRVTPLAALPSVAPLLNAEGTLGGSSDDLAGAPFQPDRTFGNEPVQPLFSLSD